MIFDKVREVIADVCNVDTSGITMETQLVADLGLNSFELVNLLIAFEDKMEIEIDDDNLPELNTVGDIVNYIETLA